MTKLTATTFSGEEAEALAAYMRRLIERRCGPPRTAGRTEWDVVARMTGIDARSLALHHRLIDPGLLPPGGGGPSPDQNWKTPTRGFKVLGMIPSDLRIARDYRASAFRHAWACAGVISSRSGRVRLQCSVAIGQRGWK